MPKQNRVIGLSAKVLERKRHRLYSRVSNTMIIAFVSIVSFSVAISAYEDIKRERLISESSWQGFKMSGDGIGGEGHWISVSGKNSDGIPRVILINGQNWDLVKVNHFDDANEKNAGIIQAETYCDKRTIAYIIADNPVVMRSNLMHEIYHAGACIHGGDTWWNSENPTKTVHQGVYNLGEFSASFLHDNPEFDRYLMQ